MTKCHRGYLFFLALNNPGRGPNMIWHLKRPLQVSVNKWFTQLTPGDRELMPSQWQRSQTLTQIQLCPPGDGQMDTANVSPVPSVSIIDPGKKEKTDMRGHNDPVSACKVPRSCSYVCVFPPSRRGGSCDSFYCHTALGALTASEGPSERPNVNLMTWRWANDKYARWRWQPFFSPHLYDFSPSDSLTTPQVLFSQSDVPSITLLCVAGSHCCEFQQ